MEPTYGDCIAVGSPREGRSPNGFWTRERIVEAVILWNDRYGAPPTAFDWNAAWARKHNDSRALDFLWPWIGTVQNKFGSWNAAIAAAGFSTREPGKRGPQRWVERKQPIGYQRRVHRDGVVYCASAVGAQLVKIGFTAGDPERRIASLQTSCPHEIELIKVRKGGSTEEKRLHDLLKDHRRSGEWFDFNEAVMAAIFSELPIE